MNGLVAALALFTLPPSTLAFEDFDRRAADLEEAARGRPRAASSAEALAEASLLRLGLGQREEAESAARSLEAVFRARRPDLVARVALAHARQHAGLLEWAEVRAILVRARPVLGPGAAIDDRLEGHALLGRALARLGRRNEAELEFRRAIALEKREGIGARGRDALGEAWFFFADRADEMAKAIVLPPYRGSGDRESVMAYLKGPAERWAIKKRHALEVAEVAHLRVLGIVSRPPLPPAGGGDPDAPITPWGVDGDAAKLVAEPPSPRWAIAALTRLSLSWAEYVRAMRSLPVVPVQPLIIDGEDFRPAFISYVDPPSYRYEERAKVACARVLSLGLTHHISNDDTRACEAWLSKSYSAEYHVLDELRPRIGAPRAAGEFAPVGG